MHIYIYIHQVSVILSVISSSGLSSICDHAVKHNQTYQAPTSRSLTD